MTPLRAGLSGVLGFVVLFCCGPIAVGQQPEASSIPPRNSGPAARSETRVYRHRRKTVRVIRRTPEVMREDAARVKRGDLFSTWSNEYQK
jgi:hypothetical protein